MKNNKRFIIFILLLLLVLMVTIPCVSAAFDFREQPYSAADRTVGRPSYADIQLLADTANTQLAMGSIAGNKLVFLGFSSGQNALVAVTTNNFSALSVNVSGDNITFSGASLFAYLYSSSYGFFRFTNASSFTYAFQNVYYSSLPIDHADNPFYPVNSNASYGSTDLNITNIYYYWVYQYESISQRDEREEEIRTDAYNSGYLDGDRDGYEDGYEYGYASGHYDGESTGYANGHTEGYTEGYLNGSSAGYNDGYEHGFNDGYEDGFNDGFEEVDVEVVTEIIYKEPVDIDFGSIFDGVSSVPQNTIGTVFDFTIGDINVAGLLRLLIIVFVISAVIVFIVKKL